MTRIADQDLARRFATRAVHAGYVGDPLSGAVMQPIYQTSTYVQEGLGRHKGYEYARTRNPTREALERNVAALEGGRHGFAFGSGLAALDAVMKLLSAGDHVVSGENVYGGSHRQMTHIWARMGITFTFVDGGDAKAVAAAVTPATKIVYAETPTNPMMRLCDLAATGEIARKARALFVVDNTFATPYFQQPLEFGADRSEEHTSELQSRLHLVCRLLLEKKKKCRASSNNQYYARNVAPEQLTDACYGRLIRHIDCPTEVDYQYDRRYVLRYNMSASLLR